MIKLRPGKIAKLAAAILNRRANLLSEESAAPGGELALVPKAKGAFGPEPKLRDKTEVFSIVCDPARRCRARLQAVD